MRVAFVVAALAAVAPAQDVAEQPARWPQFLGPGSVATGSGASTLAFDRESDLRYRVALPAGESSPCIWGDHVFLTGYDGTKLWMLALDRNSGKELWRHGVKGPEQTEFMHKDAGVAMPTACTDGDVVVFYFPSYGLVARHFDGKLAWEKTLPEPKVAFGMGSSPAIHDGLVYLLRDGCPDAALYALDVATGKQAWSVPRLRYKDSHTTPFVWRNTERTELIIASTGAVVSFDPKSGEEWWRVEGLTALVCTTPTASEDRLYFAGWSTSSAAGPDRVLAGLTKDIDLTDEQRTDPKLLFESFDGNGDGSVTPDEMPDGRAKLFVDFMDQNKDGGISMREWMPLMRMPQMGKNLLVSIKPGGKGDVTKTHVEWSHRRGIPYVSSPLLYEGRIYLVKAGGLLSCLDAKTGKERFRRSRLGDGSEYYATPVGVDGHVVVCSSEGTIYVLEVADQKKVVTEVALEEPLFATPAVVDGTIYVRTREALYAFGSSGEER